MLGERNCVPIQVQNSLPFLPLYARGNTTLKHFVDELSAGLYRDRAPFRRNRYEVWWLVVLLTFVLLWEHQQPKSQANNSYNGFDLVDKAGNIIRKPTGYRDNYQILGTF
jgi:hypothetical protein